MRFEHFRGNLKRGKASGFSLLEMIIASAILLVGILSVVQLVPASLRSNLYNRMDTTAMTIAQHELDQMVNQLEPCPAQTPVQTSSLCLGLAASSFKDENGNTMSLGGNSGAYGASVVMQGPQAVIDFGAPLVVGYYLQNYQAANDPSGTTFELRWAVISAANSAGSPVSKRIIIGCRQTNAAQPMLPVNLDTSVQK